jgi:exodeoxyribonuclease III
VIWTGDLNGAHEEVDLKNPKSNSNTSAGFCDAERAGMTNVLEAGFDDTFRRLRGAESAFTYWGMRSNGYASDTGWRLDYWITSQSLRPRIEETMVRKQVYGCSDHCPVGIILGPEA